MSDQADTNLIPPAPAAAPSVLIKVEPTPKPKRGKALALVAVAALLVGGFVTYLVTADGSGGEQYSLAEALRQSNDSQSSEFEMSLSMGALGGIDAEGRVDVEANVMAMSMDMSIMGGPELNMIIDLNEGVAYVDTEGLGDMEIDVPTRWVSMGAGEVSGMGPGLGSNPADMTDVLADSDLVEDVGFEEFRGEKVRLYRVTVPIEKVLAGNPELTTQYEDLGAELPESFVYEVFVTKNNELRRMAFEMDLMGQAITTEFVFTGYGDIEPIVLPDPSDVTEDPTAIG